MKKETNSCLFYFIFNIYIFISYFFSGTSVQTRPRKLSYPYITSIKSNRTGKGIFFVVKDLVSY